MATKQRLDRLLVERGLASSRGEAQALIMAGRVFRGEQRLDKSGTGVPADTPLEVRGRPHPWVSRGGVKLAHGLEHCLPSAQSLDLAEHRHSQNCTLFQKIDIVVAKGVRIQALYRQHGLVDGIVLPPGVDSGYPPKCFAALDRTDRRIGGIRRHRALVKSRLRLRVLRRCALYGNDPGFSLRYRLSGDGCRRHLGAFFFAIFRFSRWVPAGCISK